MRSGPASASTLGATLQPLDSDLTAIAALATTSFGRSLLSSADGAALLAAAGAQGSDSDLTAIAALSTTSYGRAVLALQDQAALVALLPGYQPVDSDLTAIAAVTTTAFGRALLALADATALGQAMTARPLTVSFLIAPGTAAPAWTAQPAGETELFGTLVRHPVDLTGYTQFRIVLIMAATAANAGAVISGQYTTTAGGALVDLDDAGDVLMDTASAPKVGAWTNLPAGAKADVFVQVTGKGGNGVISPSIRLIEIQFR